MRRNENNGLYKFLLIILTMALAITLISAFGTGNKYVIVSVTKSGVAQTDETVWVSYYDSAKQANVSGKSTTWPGGKTLQIPIPTHVSTIYVQVDGKSYSATIGASTTTTVYIYQ